MSLRLLLEKINTHNVYEKEPWELEFENEDCRMKLKTIEGENVDRAREKTGEQHVSMTEHVSTLLLMETITIWESANPQERNAALLRDMDISLSLS